MIDWGSSLLQKAGNDIQAKDEAVFLRSQDLADFVSREQLNDETRHRLALLSLPAEYAWQKERILRGSVSLVIFIVAT
jgi:hypothetical protein